MYNNIHCRESGRKDTREGGTEYESEEWQGELQLGWQRSYERGWQGWCQGVAGSARGRWMEGGREGGRERTVHVCTGVRFLHTLDQAGAVTVGYTRERQRRQLRDRTHQQTILDGSLGREPKLDP